MYCSKANEIMVLVVYKLNVRCFYSYIKLIKAMPSRVNVYYTQLIYLDYMCRLLYKFKDCTIFLKHKSISIF